MPGYLFVSERLGFRNWRKDDLPHMQAINADPDVMRFFPSLQTSDETAAFIDRMQKLFEERGFCYFPVELLDTSEFIGFIGLAVQDFEADFTPCIDIGWRLKKEAWNMGYATEGAIRCLEYAFETLQLDNIYAMAPEINGPSVNVIKKTGMTFVKYFIHPKLEGNEKLCKCVLYVMTKNGREAV